MADGQEQKTSLAFTFQKKKVIQKVAIHVEECKDIGQLISGIEGAKIQVVGGSEKKTYVIPKIENTYKTGIGPKKFTPSFKPPKSDAEAAEGEDRFEQAASTVPVITEYGLQLRENRPGSREAGAGPSNGAGGSTTAAALEARAFSEAVRELPDEMEVEAYQAMPIEEFGRAMLRGMGWEEGMGVGRNRKKVDAIEYVRRPERLGLGAEPVMLAPDTTKPVKMGEKPREQDLVLAPDADGRQRNIRKLDEQLVARSTVLPGPQPGKAMRITSGAHAGLACTALEALPPRGGGPPERWLVRLAASQEEVDVLVSELGEKWDKERTRQTDRERDAAAVGGSGGGGGSGRRERDSDGPGPSVAANGGRGGGGARHGDRERERDRREGSVASAGAREPSPRRGAGRGADERQYDRQYGRDRDLDRRRERDRERYDDDGGGGGKRRHRNEPKEDEEGGRWSKKTRGSADREHQGDDRRDNRHDGDGDGREHHQHKHHRKHENTDKKEKKDKKDKKEKRDKDRDRGRQRDDDRGGGGCERLNGGRSRGGGGSGSESEDDEHQQQQQPGAPQAARHSGLTWLFPNIKVRIVDRSIRGGKLYLKKGAVVDVHPGRTADVAVDDTGDVLRLPESSLETVVPRHEGAAVLVVVGRYRGARGRLLHASTSSGAAAVQLAADFSIVRLLLDDVAGYVGELDDE